MTDTSAAVERPDKSRKRDRTHWLYIAVIVAVLAGVAVGLLAPDTGSALGVLGTLFVSLIKMMISPVIFCTIVLGIGSVRKAASVGKVGGMALAYFLVMSTVALGIGLVVGNLISPGTGLNIAADPGAGAKLAEKAHGAGGMMDFVEGIIPTSLLSSLTAGNVLQTLFVALLVGFGLQAMAKTGEPILRGIGLVQKLVFRILAGILWLAPIGAFGAIAKVVGDTGFDAVIQLGVLMLAFYLTCIIFVFGVLGTLLRAAAGVSIFKLVRYLAREYLLIVATSSSESALPRLIAKLEHAGVQPTTVGIVVPAGYSFNLDGTAIYLTMASLFIADAMGNPLSLGEQLSLLVFMIIASKGAAGVSGEGMSTLTGGLKSHRPELLDGIG
ncbi:MAG: putative sodium/dicarboxylate symporter [Mycobacterium sp.]|nr:putative sodium/dicarboxylate symporter [Mycobacterium sp.]